MKKGQRQGFARDGIISWWHEGVLEDTGFIDNYYCLSVAWGVGCNTYVATLVSHRTIYLIISIY